MLRVFDVFCGTGGFSSGLEAASPEFITIELGVDILRDCLETFAANHRTAKVIRHDIRKLTCQEVVEVTGLKPGEVDVIIGGPPCQGFSSIRPFRSSSFDDPRNSLFEQLANFVNFFRPKIFVMENVVGLATHNDGKTITQITECISNIGYDCDWKILNSANFGVPQRRERLIFMGVESGIPLLFPKPTHHSHGSTIGYRDKSRMITFDDLPLFANVSSLERAITVFDAISDLPELDSGDAATQYNCSPLNVYQNNRRNGAKKLSLHSSTKHTPKMLNIIKQSGNNISSIPKHLITSGFSSCYSRLDKDSPSVTITVNFVHPSSNRCIHPTQDRALTPREGARLQSFDDTFEFRGTRSQIVKQIGNAVPPLLGFAIGNVILKMLN